MGNDGLQKVSQEELVAEAQRMEDYEWALDRVTRMCASALVDAQVYRQKLLKGFGYPNEVFHSAQDYRALSIILSALQQAQARPEIGERLRQLAARMEQRGNVIGGDYGHYRAPADPEILKWADELLKLAEQFAAPPRERGEWEAIEQAARLLREWAGDRQQASGRWTPREQAGVECAIRLEAMLSAPPAPLAEGRTE